jgi:SOS-response transcriptional repressor LexA
MSDRELRVSATSSSLRVLTLEFIRRYFRDYGSSPSFREIAAKFDITPQRVSAILRELYRRGEILWTPGLARSIRLPEKAAELSDTEVLEVLRRRGWFVVARSAPDEIETAQAPAPPAERRGEESRAWHEHGMAS